MFSKILIAYDESPESGRALLTGIQLAKSLNAELRAVSVQENLPPYAGYIDAEVPGGTALLRQQAADYYRELLARARAGRPDGGRSRKITFWTPCTRSRISRVLLSSSIHRCNIHALSVAVRFRHAVRFELRHHRHKALHPRHSWPRRMRGMRQPWRSRPGLPTCQAEHSSPSLSSCLPAHRPVEDLPESEYRCGPG